MELDSYRAAWQPRIDAELGRILDEVARETGCPPRLAEGMRYAALGSGKRLRPVLALAATRAVSGDEAATLRPACALELIHAYSLVHDDLPALDDDDFRRGRPTCHRAFGEPLAILVGDGLLTLAFAVLARAVPAALLPAAIAAVADGAGPAGMVGGQVDDVAELVAAPTVAEVEAIHARKTGALFRASLLLGGLLGGATDERLAALKGYATALGLAFQIADDWLAWAGDEVRLGRPTGSDVTKKRRTHPLAAGPEASRARAAALVAEARLAIADLPAQADILRALADLVSARLV
jgi:geranylgeranyl diphosphate synthase, type II